MILLFPDEETAFDSNGIGSLSDAISCTVTEERNGVYELELEYPVTGIHYAEIHKFRILFVKPDPYRNPQPFRIYRITKPISGRVRVYAQHISYDLSSVVTSPFTASSVQAALNGLKSNAATQTPFTFWTDKSTKAAFSVPVPASIRSRLGGTQGSVLDAYGGEYEFDRFTVKLWNQRGQDSGVTIKYGKNLTDLQQDENIQNFANAVYPYWKGGEDELVTLPEKIVRAPTVYTFVRVIALDLSTDFQDKPTVSQLRSRAQAYISDNKIGVPAVSITVAFQALEQTEEYKDLMLLERVNLCDTVTVEYPELGVSATAKCVKTVYDALKNRYSSIELGEARSNIAGTIASQQQQIKDFPSSSVFQQAVNNATSWITNGQEGEMIAVKKNGKWVEIASLDTGDIDTAQSVWRWNNGGIGHSKTGYNGPYTTAMLADGSINAEVITSGVLNANIIKAGTLSSQNAKCSINLDTGECQMTGTYTSEWVRSDGKKGTITVNPGGVSFSLDGKHRGSIYLSSRGECAVSSAAYRLHKLKYNGDWDNTDKDIAFAWIGEDGTTYVKADYILGNNSIVFYTSDTYRGSINEDGWTGWIKGYDPVWKTVTIDGQTITYLGR